MYPSRRVALARSFSVVVSTRCLQFKRFIHIETTRLEHQGGKNVRGDMPGLVLRNNIRFLGNLPTVYMIIGTFMLLFWCVAMGFVFWAENYHRKALLIRTHHAAQKEMAWSLQNLGFALSEQGNHTMAIEHYQKALVLLATVYDPAHSAIIQMNLGRTYYHQGSHTQALSILIPAEQRLRQMSDAFNLAKLLTIKGLCYLAQHQWEAAESAFQASSDLFQQLNDLSWYLNAYDGLGISYLERGQYAQALTIFTEIVARLPKIEGTPAHKYLTATLAIQIAQAEAKQVERGKSVYFPSQNRN